jgi:circadian clock protein KaiC
MTTLLAQADAQVEATATGISTLADAWIHLSYVVRSGERNRALTIVKSRGSFHSNQVRELVLTSSGVSLADVFLEGGEVLMGTLRKQKEIDEQARRDRESSQRSAAENAAKLAVAETRARLTALEHELELREAALRSVKAEGELAFSARASRQSELRHLRRADLEKPSRRAGAKVRRTLED